MTSAFHSETIGKILMNTMADTHFPLLCFVPFLFYVFFFFYQLLPVIKITSVKYLNYLVQPQILPKKLSANTEGQRTVSKLKLFCDSFGFPTLCKPHCVLGSAPLPAAFQMRL